MKKSRWIRGYDETGCAYMIHQVQRWDYVYGVGWVSGWETQSHTIKYL